MKITGYKQRWVTNKLKRIDNKQEEFRINLLSLLTIKTKQL